MMSISQPPSIFLSQSNHPTILTAFSSVMIVGLGGNNGTTVVAGCIANKEVRAHVCLCVLPSSCCSLARIRSFGRLR